MTDDRRHPRSNRWSPSRRLAESPFPRRGFNLIELLAVISIATILAATLMPGLRLAREATERILCASNLRQIGTGLHAYSADFLDRLPSSVHLSATHYKPQQMMAATAGPDEDARLRWDGLGLLASPRHPYLDSPRALFCPSHDGEHPYERYADLFVKPAFIEDIYTNYHYRGAIDRATNRTLSLAASHRVLVADGLRTKRDFNHEVGLNRLHADASVDWYSDNDRAILTGVPGSEMEDGVVDDAVYDWLWARLEAPR